MYICLSTYIFHKRISNKCAYSCMGLTTSDRLFATMIFFPSHLCFNVHKYPTLICETQWLNCDSDFFSLGWGGGGGGGGNWMTSKFRCILTKYWKGWKSIALESLTPDVVCCIHLYIHKVLLFNQPLK